MMKLISKLGIALCTLSLTCVVSTTAMAHDAGDILLRVGVGTVAPNVDSGTVSGLPDGVNNATVEVDNNTQLSLTAAYMFTPNIGVELLAATPFSHDISGGGDLAGVNVGSTKHLPPTLTAQYYFGGKDAAFKPYIGVGFNYTIFFSEEADRELINTVNTLPTIVGLGGTNSIDMSLDDSFGLAGVVGADIKVAENWFINVAVWYIDINTTATLKTDLGTTHKVDVELDPWVFNFAVGYKF